MKAVKVRLYKDVVELILSYLPREFVQTKVSDAPLHQTLTPSIMHYFDIVLDEEFLHLFNQNNLKYFRKHCPLYDSEWRYFKECCSLFSPIKDPVNKRLLMEKYVVINYLNS